MEESTRSATEWFAARVLPPGETFSKVDLGSAHTLTLGISRDGLRPGSTNFADSSHDWTVTRLPAGTDTPLGVVPASYFGEPPEEEDFWRSTWPGVIVARRAASAVIS